MSTRQESGHWLKDAVLLAGPTAVGKSEVALLLAERLRGEIISVDSMQVYRGLDIGTAKPTAAERARIPHHLLDVVELTEAFNAAQFLVLAKEAVRQIRARGRVPIFCGGTGLYFKALIGGLVESVAGDPQLRRELESTPLPVLLSELQSADHETYARIDKQNLRRVVRALEVIRLTGRPFSSQQADWSPLAAANANQNTPLIFALARGPEDLRNRINNRVDRMFEQGLVVETQRLLEAGLRQNRVALQALGYRQVIEHFAGQRPLAETIQLVKTRTWQFARRQMSWFRNQLDVRWIELSAEDSSQSALNKLIEQGAQLRLFPLRSLD